MRLPGRIGAGVVAALAATVAGCLRDRDAAVEPAVTVRDADASSADAAAASVAPAATAAVHVVVREFAGAPVVGARVVARPPQPDEFKHWPGMEAPTSGDGWRSLPPSWDLAPRAETVTGADGGATLTGLPLGAWSVVVDARGRVRRSACCRLAAAGGAAELTIAAETGHPLVGRVLTETGAPVVDAFLVAEYPGIAPGGKCDAAAPDFATARSGADGRFRFDALPSTVVAIRCGPANAWSSHVWPVRVPSVASIDLRMTTRGPVEGVVRGEPDGNSVAGAQVVFAVSTWHTANVTAYATTDADGRYQIPVYPGDGVMEISVEAKGWWPAAKVVDARQPPFRLYEDRPTVINLAVHPDAPEFADVRGVVRGPDGSVAGATVFLTTRGGESWSAPSRTTDERGRFWFFDVPARRVAVVCDNPAGLYEPGVHRLFADDGPPPDPAAPWWIAADAKRPVDVDVALARGGRVSGRVVDEEGKPVAGAEVCSRNGVRSTSLDDGTFVIEGLDEPSQATVWARSRGGALVGDSAKFTAGAGADVVDVEVRVHAEPRKTTVVIGRAHAADSTASMRDARVECERAWTPLDASGAFRVEIVGKVVRKEVALRVVVPGWGERTVDVAVTSASGSADAGDVEVPRAGGIRGRVADADGPVAGAVVRIEPRRETTGIACGFDEDPEPPIAAVTDRDGRFQSTGFAAGAYDVHVAAPDFIEEQSAVDVAAGGAAAECTIRLCRAAMLVGRVLLRDGRAISRASIRAELADDGGDRSKFRENVYSSTDDDGRFEMRVREGVEYVVEVSDHRESNERFRTSRSGPHVPDGKPVEIVVDEGATIAGRVVDAEGRAVAGASVSCEVKGDERDRSHETRSAADGAFALTALLDASYDVTVTAGLDDPVVVSDVHSGRDHVEIRLTTASTIAGVLLDEDGNAASGRKLIAKRMSADCDGAAECEVDAAGAFRLVRVGTAPCRIEVFDENGYGPMRKSTPLIGGAPVAPGAKRVVLRIPTRDATTVSGHVVDDAGKPFLDFTLHIPCAHSTIWHSGAAAGAEFEATSVRLDAPCEIVADCGGRNWTIPVPAGTRDLVITAGADGLHRVEAGGHPIATLPELQRR